MLLDRFEATSSAQQQKWAKEEPKKKAQIMAAVNSHFENSNRFTAGKRPKIGKKCKS